MANLKNSIINDTGYIKLPSGTTSQRGNLNITLSGLFDNNTAIAANGLALTISGNGSAWAEYRNLPDYLLGLRTTTCINDTNGSTWALPDCRVYLMRQDSWSAVSTSGWTLIETDRPYLTGYNNTMYIYYRDFAAGNYTFDNNSAMYLFDVIPSAGVVRYNTEKSKVEFYTTEYNGKWEDFTVPWLYRSVITNGYILGGYKSGVTYKRVNRTVAATDVTTDLGDLLDRTFNYKAGAVGLDRIFVFGSGNAHNASSNLTTGFSSRTETAFTPQSRSHMANARGHMGTVFKEHYYTWIMGGNRGEIERFSTTTEMMVTASIPGNPSYGGQGGATAGGPWGITCHENYGILYSGEGSGGGVGQWNLEFATETLTTRSGTHAGQHFQQKSIQSKLVNGYAGNEGSWRGGYQYRRTNFVTNSTTNAGISKAYTNCGEENYTMGQDHQYMLGQYNGLQNNLSAKFVYATEVQTTGASSMQPSGIPGTSSGIGGWRD